MDNHGAQLLWNLVAKGEEGRHRVSPSTPVTLSGPVYPMRIPLHHLYSSVTVPPVSSHVYPASYPSSPSFNSHQPHFPTAASASWPVFPANAQQKSLPKRSNSNSGRPIREATLHSKSQPADAPRRNPAVSPKMHLYAGSKNVKTGQAKLTEEEFPIPPANWLIGASPVDSSTSSSESHSGATTEDESSEDGFSESPRFGGSVSSEPHLPVIQCNTG